MGDQVTEEIIRKFLLRMNLRAFLLYVFAGIFLLMILATLGGSIYGVIKASDLAQSDINFILSTKSVTDKQTLYKINLIEKEKDKITIDNENLLSARNYIRESAQGRLQEWATMFKHVPKGTVRKSHFFSKKKGWVISGGEILFTTNGGHDWNRNVTKPDFRLRSAYFYDLYEGWAVDTSGNLYQYNSKEKKWDFTASPLSPLRPKRDWSPLNFNPAESEISTGAFSLDNDPANLLAIIENTPHYTDLFFLNDKLGWLIDSNGNLYTTTNGGNRWDTLLSTDYISVKKLTFVDKNIGFILSKNKLYRSEDGGRKWAPITTTGPEFDVNENDPILDFEALSSTDIYALHANSALLKTKNAGLTWEETSYSIPEYRFSSMSISDPDHGWLFYDNGKILHTEQHESPIPSQLNDADYLDYLYSDEAPFFVQTTPSFRREFNELFASRDKSADILKTLETDLETMLNADKSLAKIESQWYFTAATNGIRFSILVIAFFLVQILVGLFRYTIKLAGLHHAYAEAARLTPLTNAESILDGEMFIKLADTLAPDHLDFGKTPSAITEKLVDALRNTGSKKPI